ncbi:MAG: hypothetical protein ACTSX6_02970 [Candidatus Heimdallarchaeaceae archaeon]
MKKIKQIRETLSFVEGENILRRYFVMNGFDGALTALGIIIGSIVANGISFTPQASDYLNAKNLLLVGIGASIAMGVSGFWIAYLTERAERTRDIKELEEQMVADLDGTKVSKANLWTAIIISFVDGFSPFLFSIIAISPFLGVLWGWIPIGICYIIAMAIVVVEVLILGLFLGAVSKENKLIYALKIFPAIIIVAGLTYLLDIFT